MKDINCIKCGSKRPPTQSLCPHCNAKPYRHKTVDAAEFWAEIEEKHSRQK